MGNFNLDQLINNIRSVLRGEAKGSIKFLLVLLLTLIIWTGIYLQSDMRADAESSLKTQQSRWRTLLILGDEYKNLSSGNNFRPKNTGEIDVAAVFAQVSERLNLGNRVNRVTPDGKNQSIEINRLYAEELTNLQKQLSNLGVIFQAAELRALPSGKERLLTVNAIIGAVN